MPPRSKDRVHLTDTLVRDMPTPTEGRVEVPDEQVPGLYLIVRPSGTRAWSLVVRIHRGGVKRMALGKWPAISCRKARQLAQEAKGAAATGRDPRDRDPSTLTVAQAAESYLDRKPHAKAAFDRDVLPALGARRLATISRGDVAALMDAVLGRSKDQKQGGRVGANRLRSAFGAFLRYCYEQGWVASNPAKDIRPHREQSRERVLSPDELVKLWRGTESDTPSALAIRLALLTATRISEVVGASWQEIDSQAGIWRIPGERTKNRRPHELPLSTLAFATLDRARALGDPRWVLPGNKPGTHLHRISPHTHIRLNRVAWGIPLGFSPHDLRRSAATALADLGTAYRVVQDILNHTRGGPTGVYVRMSAIELKRTALQTWSDYLAGLLRDEVQKKDT
jgi:integrase